MKRICATCAVFLVLLLTGCGETTDSLSAAVPEATVEITAPPATDGAAILLPLETEQTEAAFDVDLTQLSSTMVYSYVYSIMADPAQYVGQRFQVEGSYEMSYWSETGLNYHFIVIADATACCAQGIEFVLPDDLSYPTEGDQIKITGTFGSYEELGDTYYYIQADSIETYE